MLGYKGFPVLAGHPPFDVTSGMVTDYMHCVLLGVAKTLLYTWLDHKHCTKDFYIGRQVNSLCGNELVSCVTLSRICSSHMCL